MTRDDRPLPPRSANYADEIRDRAEARIEAEIAEHDARRNVGPGFIITGAACLALGAYLVFADTAGTGSRVDANVAITPDRAQPSITRDRTLDTARPALSPPATERPRTSGFALDLLEDVARTAQASGVPRATTERLLAAAGTPAEDVGRLAQEQPEFTRTAGDYLTQRVTQERIDAGRRKLVENAALLTQLERRYGIDRHLLVAIWGIESNYGTNVGDRPVIRSLLSLAATDQRRRSYWRDELTAALSLVGNGDVAPDRALGSWAGALGPMQIMPSSVQRYATDFDGDGRRDVVSSLPDALATAANQLKSSGWTEGRIWAREVKLPPNFDYALSGPQSARSVAAWQMLGVRPATGLIPLDDEPTWQIVLPAGAAGPAFLASSNFGVLLKYNRSTAYAIAVGHLADRLAGGSPMSAAWPPDDVALSMNETSELQRLLAAAGFDPGPIDGIVGQYTRDALRNYQKARALVPDAHPTIAVLRQLRTERRN
ncbi:MAG TPA: lytic murein transglycosylase [Hyphomicrobiaceae bacterium]|nr:lytic murein transglycosylase [Hyphomicrobiaceae bacterium]